MGDGTDYTSFDTNQRSKQKLTIVVAAAAVALLAAGALFQTIRAQGVSARTPDDPDIGRAGVAETGTVDRSRPLAIVGDRRIDYDIVADAAIKRHGKEVLESIINRTIIQQACERRGLRVTSQEVHAEVAKIAKTFNMDVDVWYQMLQADRNITKLQYQRDVIWPMLALRKLVDEDLEKITEKNLNEAFKRHYGKRVRARMILFNNERRAREVWPEVEKVCAAADESSRSKEFGRLARKYSADPHSRPMDGKIPPIRQCSGDEELTKAAFNLEEGEISGLIQLEGSGQWVVLFCEGYTEPIVDNINVVKQDLIEQLKEENRQQAIAHKFQELKEETTIINYLTFSKTEGVHQASGTGNSGTGKSGTVRTADGLRSSKSAPRSGSTGRSGPTGRRLQGVSGSGLVRPRTK